MFAGEPEGPGRGKQRLPIAVPAARVLQQIGSEGEIQILDTQRKARGNQGHGITKVRQFILFLKLILRSFLVC